MFRRPHLHYLTASTIAVALALGCHRDTEAPAELRVGVLAMLTGERAASSGAGTVDGARLATEELNAAGGLQLNGRRHHVVLEIADVKGDAESAVAEARRLINQRHVVALVGPQFSTTAIPVASVAEAARVPMISPMSSNPKTTDGKRYVFRVAFRDEVQGTVMARFARQDLQAKRAAVLFDVTNPGSADLSRMFKDAFEKTGGIVVAMEEFTPDQGSDHRAALARVLAATPDVLFLPNFSNVVVEQIRQARALGIDAAFLGSDSWDPSTILEEPAARGSFQAHQWHADVTAASRAFVQRYVARFGRQPNSTAAATYDAFSLLFVALRAKGKSDSESIREGLAAVDRFDGVTGTLSYKGKGDPVRSVVIIRLDGADGTGQFHRVVTP